VPKFLALDMGSYRPDRAVRPGSTGCPEAGAGAIAQTD